MRRLPRERRRQPLSHAGCLPPSPPPATAAAAGSGNFVDHLKLSGEQLTQGPPPEVMSFLANDDAASDHSAMVIHGGMASVPSGLARDSPSGWGGSSTGGGSAGGGVVPTASEAGLAGAASGSAASTSAPLQKQRSSMTTTSRIDSGVSELWTVDFRELAIQKQIGEGSFGKASRGAGVGGLHGQLRPRPP